MKVKRTSTKRWIERKDSDLGLLNIEKAAKAIKEFSYFSFSTYPSSYWPSSPLTLHPSHPGRMALHTPSKTR